jgi:hypothetical protein
MHFSTRVIERACLRGNCATGDHSDKNRPKNGIPAFDHMLLLVNNIFITHAFPPIDTT